MNNYIKIVLLFLTTMLLTYCTSNPFSKDENTKSNTQIVTGKIKLSDETSPDSIYVWLEEFDIGVFTNISGEFRLSLPPAQEQPGGGVTGVFNLYFYVCNYRIDFVEVTVNNGLFLYGQGSIDREGELIDLIVLQKLLNVKTEVSPNIIPADFRGYIYVSLTMSSIQNPAKISAITDNNNIISGIFIRNLTKRNEFINQYFMTSSSISTLFVPTTSSISTSYYKYVPCEFPKGEYEIIPFIWVHQDNLPIELVNNLTSNPGAMSLDYLKIPFKRNNALMHVEYCDHTIGDDP